MKNIKIIFSYDGERFFGSQAQKGKRTVQGEIERALKELTGRRTRLDIAGRTDRGVHGLAQAANFMTSSRIPANRFPQAMNGLVGPGITVLDAREVKKSFSSRRNAKKREYLFFIFNGPHFPVMLWGRAIHERHDLNIGKMRLAAKLMKGRHDFRNLSARGSSQKGTVRRIYDLEIKVVGKDLTERLRTRGKLISIKVVADSFLYKMVRFIAGALIGIGKGRIRPDVIKEVLSGSIGQSRSVVARPCGLYLSEVKY